MLTVLCHSYTRTAHGVEYLPLVASSVYDRVKWMKKGNKPFGIFCLWQDLQQFIVR